MPDEVRHEAERLLRTSIEYAFTHPEASRTLVDSGIFDDIPVEVFLADTVLRS